jgi:Tol biopolymer transport system component
LTSAPDLLREQQLRSALHDRYTIERELGAGGMATVYLARDLKHDREVAIKVLHPDLGAALGGERFLTEIKTTAKLQHPHILPLLDSGEAAGLLFYVMPLVDGETLRTRLTREKQLALDDALRIATEAAGALDYAHRHGVIHRDIKPENILLHDGRAVVADFGIALAVSAASGPRMTQTGLSLGTPQYMAPEQAMGERQIDGRADVYALAAVLYELLTGEPPFTGATVQAIVAKVLTERPMNPTAVRDTIPRHVEAAVLKALAKLPADRFATPAQFAHALTHPDTAATTGHMPLGATPAARPRGLARHVAASPVVWVALALTAVAASAGWVRRSVPSPDPALAVTIEEPNGIRWQGPLGGLAIALSPDGSSLAFSGTDSIGVVKAFVRSLADADAPVTIASAMPGTSAFSPDGKRLATFVNANQVIQIFRLSARVGQTLGAARLFRGLTWTDDSTIVYASEGKIRRWRLNSREPEILVEAATGGGDYVNPFAVSPDLVLMNLNDGRGTNELAALSIRDKRVTRLGVSGTRVGFVDGGVVTFLSGGTLWGVEFDPSTLKTRGDPRVIAESGSGPVSAYAVARNGVLVVGHGVSASDRELVLVDRAGTARPLLTERRAYRWPRFSPEGRRIVVAVIDGPLGDLWVVGANGGGADANTLTRVTADSMSVEPEWDPDGRSLIYVRRRPGQPGYIARKAADGSGKPAAVIERPNPIFESAITPDRKTIVWREDARGAARDILMASLDSPSVARPVRTSAFDERGFTLSPDGRWLAFTSNETGTNEVYISRLEPNGASTRVSRSGGSEPRWVRTGELLYRNVDSVLVSRVTLGAEPTIGPPALLFTINGTSRAPYEPLWDASPDGQRFVMVRERADSRARLVLMVNWLERWRGQR